MKKLSLLGSALIFFLSFNAYSQTYPTKPIVMVVPYAADQPHIVFDLAQAHVMTSEHGTKVDLLITQTDPAAFSHGDQLGAHA